MKSRARLKNFLSSLASAGVAIIGLATIGRAALLTRNR